MSEAATPLKRRCSVYLENDHFNMREYVARVLIMVCEVSEAQANAIMVQASENWVAEIGTYEEEIAQHIYEGMQKAGLSSTITIVDENDDPRPRYLDGTVIEADGDMPHWYQ